MLDLPHRDKANTLQANTMPVVSRQANRDVWGTGSSADKALKIAIRNDAEILI